MQKRPGFVSTVERVSGYRVNMARWEDNLLLWRSKRGDRKAECEDNGLIKTESMAFRTSEGARGRWRIRGPQTIR